MRPRWREEVPTLALFLVFTLLVGGLAITMGPSSAGPAAAAAPYPVVPPALAAPDQDLDAYADDVDLWVGDALVRVQITSSQADRTVWLLGSDDDQWGFGAGRPLEWTHVLDPDPLGPSPGSPQWQEEALRTGSWQRARLDGPGETTLFLDVRDDRVPVRLTLERWQEDGPRTGAWDLVLDQDTWTLDGATASHGSPLTVDGARVLASWDLEIPAGERLELARQWAPELRFDSGERFFPTSGEGLLRFHGVWRDAPDLRTWDTAFDDGIDAYRLLLADFDGDGVTDHKDATVMTDVLRAGGVFPDTVYSHVARTTDGQVAIQYWFLYPYNFVLDETGQEIPALAHAGDREFIQLLFEDPTAARLGYPSSVSYGQHYSGLRVDGPVPGQAPYASGGTHLVVYPGRGSHASFPVAGDDDDTRPSFIGYGDEFDGAGERWTPDGYDLQLLDRQPFLTGTLWSPATRFDRQLGTSLHPLLAHSFTYPFQEPAYWASSLHGVSPGDLQGLYDPPEDGP